MGAIYEAVHLRLGEKRYAIKVLTPRYAANPDALARFRREALVTSGLRNEHIVEVHDFNVDGELAYLVMELLDGEDLAARLKRAGSLPADAIMRILAQVVVALDAAHRARIVHRDLKPQNIFLCTRGGRDDYVKVLDFGISKLLDSSSMLTGEHALLGTPFYMAPEQALGNSQDIDGRADVFALGAILWELLTGRMAFGAPTLSAALYKVCRVDPPDAHLARPDLAPAVSMVLRRALAKDPAGRTPDVVTLGREFAAALHGVVPDSVPPPAPGGMTTLDEVMGRAPSDTVASLPAAPAPRIVLPASMEAGASTRPASGSPNHDAGPSPAAANPVSPTQVASAARPAWMPSWPAGDEPAHPDPGVASRIATGSVHVPARRSRRRAILALVAVCVTAAGAVTGAVLGVLAHSSNDAGVAKVTAAVPPSQPPAPASQPSDSDEVAIFFEVKPADAEVSLRVDGALVTDRPIRRTRSRTPLVVTAEATGYMPFRAEPVPDRDQVVTVSLQPVPAVTAKAAPPRRAPAPASATRNATHRRPSSASTSAGAGSPAPAPDPASRTREPPAPTASPVSRPLYTPSPSVTEQVPRDAGVSSSPAREASAPPDAGAQRRPDVVAPAGPQQPGARPPAQAPAGPPPAPAVPPPATTPPKPPLKTGTVFDNL